MASQDASRRPTSAEDEESFPTPQFPRSGPAGPASIISSRMTDIASDDGNESRAHDGTSQPKSADDRSSRPGTAKTANSAKAAWARRNPSGFAAGPDNRTTSQTSRSHVPSLTSNAFFRPMSSQKLQAHRGASRPTTMVKQQLHPHGPLDDGTTDFGGSVRRASVNSAPIAEVQPQTGNDSNDIRPPPSRGTEVTEQGTSDHITANTSPTRGHYPTDSMSDSVRPLHRKSGHLRVDTDKPYKERTNNMPSPIKSPRSFRSSFLGAHSGRNRSTDGAEKLSSNASSPQFASAHPQGRPLPRVDEQQKKQSGRVYQYFDGNTVFCFGGRWQNTKHRPVNIATGIFVLVPIVLFYVSEASWLWHNISPAIPITMAYLTFVCVSSFIHASVADPGILPRNLHQFPPASGEEDPLRLGPPTNDWTLVKSAESSTAAMEVPVKHCRTCNIWRPPRAHHCRLCDNCIEGHDHHCVWLNNCIGKRNYRYFFTFVTSATIVSAYMIATSLLQILTYKNRHDVKFSQAIDHFRAPFALVIVGFLAFLYPASLMGYHIFLMARGETTREYMTSHKFVKNERYRAFTQGNMLRNIGAVLCRPKPPTYYRFKSRHQLGDQRLGAVRRDQRPRASSQGLEMQNVKPTSQGFQGPPALRAETQR